MVSVNEVKAVVTRPELSAAGAAYLAYHAERLAFTVDLVQDYRDRFDARTLLDVGPHFLTICLRRLVRPQLSLTTCGWAYWYIPQGIVDRHIALDLNTCPPDAPADLAGHFDIIVFSETIEHLHTSPLRVLRYLKRMLKPRTGILIVQTPNAAALGNRLAMLSGRNPFELIRDDSKNPGHFREYTMDELIGFGREVGLRPYRQDYCLYWRANNPAIRALERLYPPFRKGMTLSFTAE